MYMVPYHMVINLAFWLCLLAIPTLTTLVDLFTFFLWKTFDRNLWELESLRRRSGKGDPWVCEASSSRRNYRPIDDDETCTDDSADSDEIERERVRTSRVAQQRCVGWTPPAITGVCLMGLLAVVGLLLLGTGLCLYSESRGASQMRIHYEGAGNADPMGTDSETEVFEACRGGAVTCKLSVTVPRAMSRPILVHYVVGPFYQNFNDYIVSEVSKELGGDLVTPEQRAAKCTESTMVSDDGKEIVPCGMKATSLFNDVFTISAGISTEGIAWASDKERYNNPPDYPGRPGTSWLNDRYPHIVPVEEGVKNDHFIAWMRPSALNYAWKQYGWLDKDLEEGEELSISIENNFPVSAFNGSKQLVITEVGPLGGRGDKLGLFLILCGVGCYLLGGIALAVEKYVGDPESDSSDDDGSDKRESAPSRECSDA